MENNKIEFIQKAYMKVESILNKMCKISVK